MRKDRPPRRADLTPEQQARIEAIRRENRTPEARARHAAVREHFQDKPSLALLIERGEIDPGSITTMGGVAALHRAMATVRRARETKGLTLTDVANRSGMPLPALSRLDRGKNPNFTFETLARYAAAVGLDLEIVVRDRPAASTVGERPTAGARTETLDAITSDLEQLLEQARRRSGELRDALTGTAPN